MRWRGLTSVSGAMIVSSARAGATGSAVLVSPTVGPRSPGIVSSRLSPAPEQPAAASAAETAATNRTLTGLLVPIAAGPQPQMSEPGAPYVRNAKRR